MKSFKFIPLIKLISLCFLFCLLPSTSEAEPEKIVVGFYVNDIQAIDLRTHSYVVDFYLWFRWSNNEINPSETFEFMNTFDPEAHVGELIYDESLPQPDGSLYNIIRHQGAFSSKFNVATYPFDDQNIIVTIEDAEFSILSQNYVPDTIPIVLNENIKLPGYQIGVPELIISNTLYPTNFGDLNEEDNTAYSRATIKIPIKRPIISGIVKSFVPMLLIVMCALLALFLDPVHVEARVGLTITSLLALVAMQFTSTTSLPEVGYLLLIEQLYLVSYIFILVVIALVVYGTRIDEQGALQGGEGSLVKMTADSNSHAIILTISYFIAFGAILLFNL